MARTFFMDLNRLDEDETPVVIAYSYKPGTPDSWEEPGDGPEIELEDCWLKSDENKRDAPTVKYTDAEGEEWCEIICEKHVDEPDDYADT